MATKATKSVKPEMTQPAVDAAPNRRREVQGVVVSDKMQKTVVVRIDRKVMHTFYKKYVTRSVRVKAHDEKNEAKVGDLVQLVQTRPLSKDKRWALQKIVRRAGLAQGITV